MLYRNETISCDLCFDHGMHVLVSDSIREVHKYTSPSETVDLKHNPDAEHLAMMKLFRAQRNFYISGFALFLWLWVWYHYITFQHYVMVHYISNNSLGDHCWITSPVPFDCVNDWDSPSDEFAKWWRSLPAHRSYLFSKVLTW